MLATTLGISSRQIAFDHRDDEDVRLDATC
jgi:hypothetical protein